jgi:hypothetical protein
MIVHAGFCGLAAVLCGCAADRPADVPAAADDQVDGANRLVYTAPSSGQVWITDVGSNSVIYAGQVRGGQEVAVDPDNNRVTVGGNIVATHDISRADHRIFFEPGMTLQLGANNSDLASRNIARPANVPTDARLTGEGAQRMMYTAEGDGTIWVVDVPNNIVIYSGRVARGDQVVVDPDANNLTVNGSKVSDQKLLPDVSRRIFFMASNGPISTPPM